MDAATFIAITTRTRNDDPLRLDDQTRNRFGDSRTRRFEMGAKNEGI